MDEEFALKILDSREERSHRQRDLIDKYGASLISFTLNTPGIEKDNAVYRDIHKIGYDEIINRLEAEKYNIIFRDRNCKETGPEGFIVVDSTGDELKELMVEMEIDHPLGRIFDIDVFDENFEQIGREELKLEPRRCILCDKEVRLCMREKNHSYEELISEVNKRYTDYIESLSE